MRFHMGIVVLFFYLSFQIKGVLESNPQQEKSDKENHQFDRVNEKNNARTYNKKTPKYFTLL